MLSHDLARALFARRNNDVKVEVILNHVMIDKEGDVIDNVETEPDLIVSTVLRDHEDSEPYTINSNHIVVYDSLADAVIIKASIVSYFTEKKS